MGDPIVNALLEFESEEATAAPAATHRRAHAIYMAVAAAIVLLLLGMASNQTAATAATSPIGARGSSAARATARGPALAITYPNAAAELSVTEPYILLGGTSSHAASIAAVSTSAGGRRRAEATGTATWIAAVPLERGDNAIEITARSSTGEVTKREVVVKRR